MKSGASLLLLTTAPLAGFPHIAGFSTPLPITATSAWTGLPGFSTASSTLLSTVSSTGLSTISGSHDCGQYVGFLNERELMWQPFAEGMLSPAFWRLAIGSSLCYLIIFAITQQFILHLQSPSVGFNATQAASAYSMLFSFSLAGKFVFGWLRDRPNPWRAWPDIGQGARGYAFLDMRFE
ncbi:MAG: hypothetical protein ACKV2V_28580 [Blastocatellia bacterium]